MGLPVIGLITKGFELLKKITKSGEKEQEIEALKVDVFKEALVNVLYVFILLIVVNVICPRIQIGDWIYNMTDRLLTYMMAQSGERKMIDIAKGYLALIWTGWISVVLYLIGGFDILIKAMLIMMVLDYITGVLKGYKEKNVNSRRAYKGLSKKIVVLGIIVAATQMDIILQGVGIRTLVLMFYVATEFLSILENAAILGVPIPTKLKIALEQYRDKQDIKKTE